MQVKKKDYASKITKRKGSKIRVGENTLQTKTFFFCVSKQKSSERKKQRKETETKKAMKVDFATTGRGIPTCGEVHDDAGLTLRSVAAGEAHRSASFNHSRAPGPVDDANRLPSILDASPLTSVFPAQLFLSLCPSSR